MNRFSGKPFALLGLHALGASPETLKGVMAREKLNWRSFADGRAIADLWSARSTPGYYAIDHQGVIRHKWLGYPGEQALDEAIEALVADAEARVQNPAGSD